MTQENKELLLKDLCARLSHGVMIQHPELFRPSILVTEKLDEYYKGHFGSDGDSVEFVKPYLRPISSITEEEKRYLMSLKYQPSAFKWKNLIISSQEIIDWLNAHHFDYRGLIEKGLALEAPEGMYNLK